MAVENKRMQQRYGTYSQFQADKSNLLPNEFASVTANDPNTTSGKALYFNPESGEPNRLLTDEDKSAIDANVSQAVQDAAMAVHTTESLQIAMNIFQQQLQRKIEMPAVENYAYSKEGTQHLLQLVLSNYYTAYMINDMLSYGSEEITTLRFAGKPYYSWLKLGFKAVEEQHVGGVCLMVIDSPVCTGDDTTLSVPLPFPPAQAMKIPIVVGNQTTLYDIAAGEDSFDITGIGTNDKVSGVFAYRIGVDAG